MKVIDRAIRVIDKSRFTDIEFTVMLKNVDKRKDESYTFKLGIETDHLNSVDKGSGLDKYIERLCKEKGNEYLLKASKKIGKDAVFGKVIKGKLELNGRKYSGIYIYNDFEYYINGRKITERIKGGMRGL